jgi:sugar lactone lactonase YvrE
MRLDPDGLKTVLDLAPVAQLLNDMVVDGTGRAYLDVYLPRNPLGESMIVMVEPNGTTYRTVAENLKLVNGLAITPDGKTLVASEFMANRIIAFDIAADGGLSNQRVFAEVDGSPDGICLDAEGAAWVGLPYQNKFRRIKPGGEVTHEIAYDNKWGVAPVLGGADRRSLFLCTSDITLEKMGKMPHNPDEARKLCNSWIEVVENIAVPGVGWP